MKLYQITNLPEGVTLPEGVFHTTLGIKNDDGSWETVPITLAPSEPALNSSALTRLHLFAKDSLSCRDVLLPYGLRKQGEDAVAFAEKAQPADEREDFEEWLRGIGHDFQRDPVIEGQYLSNRT